MKFQPSELPIGKPQTRRKTSKLAPLVALTILLTIPLYYPTIKDSAKRFSEETSPAFDPLEDSIKPTSHVEPSPIETTRNKSCSGDSGQCGDDDNDNSKAEPPPPPPAVDHRAPPPPIKKHDKGRRKKAALKTQTGSVIIDQARNHKKSSSSQQESVKTEPNRGSNDRGTVRSRILDDEQCDLFSGEWVPEPNGPYYTNETCNAIQEHQNCLKFGRPDREFLKWRWKPDECELPVFDPNQFLELVRGKSIAFVGDSVARNHMQSLICLLSRVSS